MCMTYMACAYKCVWLIWHALTNVTLNTLHVKCVYLFTVYTSVVILLVSGEGPNSLKIEKQGVWVVRLVYKYLCTFKTLLLFDFFISTCTQVLNDGWNGVNFFTIHMTHTDDNVHTCTHTVFLCTFQGIAQPVHLNVYNGFKLALYKCRSVPNFIELFLKTQKVAKHNKWCLADLGYQSKHHVSI